MDYIPSSLNGFALNVKVTNRLKLCTKEIELTIYVNTFKSFSCNLVNLRGGMLEWNCYGYLVDLFAFQCTS